MKDYIDNVAVASSQLINALTGGMAGEMLCSRVWRGVMSGSVKAAMTAKVLNKMFLDEDHCKKTYEDTVSMRYVPDEIKEKISR